MINIFSIQDFKYYIIISQIQTASQIRQQEGSKHDIIKLWL